jgi:hypothetical protein
MTSVIATLRFEVEWTQIIALVGMLFFIGFVFGGVFGVYREGRDREKRWRVK